MNAPNAPNAGGVFDQAFFDSSAVSTSAGCAQFVLDRFYRGPDGQRTLRHTGRRFEAWDPAAEAWKPIMRATIEGAIYAAIKTHRHTWNPHAQVMVPTQPTPVCVDKAMWHLRIILASEAMCDAQA